MSLITKNFATQPLFLDNQHRLIEFVDLFRGMINGGVSVYPREVVRAALGGNAAAVIFCHHPSGIAEPSEADKSITRKLKDALALMDIRVLDHFVIGGEDTYSFAGHGLL